MPGGVGAVAAVGGVGGEERRGLLPAFAEVSALLETAVRGYKGRGELTAQGGVCAAVFDAFLRRL